MALTGFAVEHFSRYRPSKIITGMALGWDQAVAGACIGLGIPFIAAIPFDAQPKKWSREEQGRWSLLYEHAERVVTVTDYYSTKNLQVRNQWMVDRADKVVALWDGGFGGTFNCIQYANSKNIPVSNLWGDWNMEDDLKELLG